MDILRASGRSTSLRKIQQLVAKVGALDGRKSLSSRSPKGLRLSRGEVFNHFLDLAVSIDAYGSNMSYHVVPSTKTVQNRPLLSLGRCVGDFGSPNDPLG